MSYLEEYPPSKLRGRRPKVDPFGILTVAERRWAETCGFPLPANIQRVDWAPRRSRRKAVLLRTCRGRYSPGADIILRVNMNSIVLSDEWRHTVTRIPIRWVPSNGVMFAEARLPKHVEPAHLQTFNHFCTVANQYHYLYQWNNWNETCGICNRETVGALPLHHGCYQTFCASTGYPYNLHRYWPHGALI